MQVGVPWGRVRQQKHYKAVQDIRKELIRLPEAQ